MKRETHKKVELADRTWSIGKFDAMTGSYIAYKVMAQIMPMLPGIHDQLGAVAPKNGKVMTKDDFIELQTDCLKVCAELLPAGPAPVLDDKGNYGVEDFDTKMAVVLTVHALVWNLRDFFEGDLSALLSEGMSDLFPPPPQT